MICWKCLVLFLGKNEKYLTMLLSESFSQQAKCFFTVYLYAFVLFQRGPSVNGHVSIVVSIYYKITILMFSNGCYAKDKFSRKFVLFAI